MAPALAALILVACAGTSVGADSEVVDNAGLPTKPLDGGLGTKDDSGLGTKDDGGLGIEEAGPPADDAGLGADGGATRGADGGATRGADAGSGTDEAGMPGLPDAGGIGGCLACAEQRCGLPAIACTHSSACVEEAKCDLTCFGASGGAGDDVIGRGPEGPHGLDPHCFQSCVNDPHASLNAFSTVACALALCPQECHGGLTSCALPGRGPGAFGERP